MSAFWNSSLLDIIPPSPGDIEYASPMPRGTSCILFTSDINDLRITLCGIFRQGHLVTSSATPRKVSPTTLIYIDESGDESCSVMSALAIPASSWLACFNDIRVWRKSLSETFGIPVRKELHAFKFVAGRGRPSYRILTKRQRADIFCNGLRMCAKLSDRDAWLFNVVCGPKSHLQCCELLVNRFQLFLNGLQGNAILFFDEGHEAEQVALLRKMRVFNPIPSHFGGSYNAPAMNILEDPVFRNSKHSVFVQLVDFCAYALLRHEKPLKRAAEYGIDKAFELLEPVMLKKASRSDKYGVVRGVSKS